MSNIVKRFVSTLGAFSMFSPVSLSAMDTRNNLGYSSEIQKKIVDNILQVISDIVEPELKSSRPIGSKHRVKQGVLEKVDLSDLKNKLQNDEDKTIFNQIENDVKRLNPSTSSESQEMISTVLVYAHIQQKEVAKDFKYYQGYAFIVNTIFDSLQDPSLGGLHLAAKTKEEKIRFAYNWYVTLLPILDSLMMGLLKSPYREKLKACDDIIKFVNEAKNNEDSKCDPFKFVISLLPEKVYSERDILFDVNRKNLPSAQDILFTFTLLAEPGDTANIDSSVSVTYEDLLELIQLWVEQWLQKTV